MKRGRNLAGKTVVMGLLARHAEKGKSQVRTEVMGRIRKGDIQGVVRQHVEAGSDVYTDAFSSYVWLERDYVHGFIDHAECYAKGNVHTNGLEN